MAAALPGVTACDSRSLEPAHPAPLPACLPADKPDLRFGLEMAEVTDIVRDCGFR